MPIIQILVVVILVILALWLVRQIPDPMIQKIIYIAIVVLVVLWLLNLFVPLADLTVPPLRR
jgi:hypothetical protein